MVPAKSLVALAVLSTTNIVLMLDLFNLFLKKMISHFQLYIVYLSWEGTCTCTCSLLPLVGFLAILGFIDGGDVFVLPILHALTM